MQDNFSLESIEVLSYELPDLLARLSAEDAVFRAPVMTIRDVAEATDKTPAEIARMLANLRGPGQNANILHRLNVIEGRLDMVESRPRPKPEAVEEPESKSLVDKPGGEFAIIGLILLGFLILAMVFSMKLHGSPSGPKQPPLPVPWKSS